MTDYIPSLTIAVPIIFLFVIHLSSVAREMDLISEVKNEPVPLLLPWLVTSGSDSSGVVLYPSLGRFNAIHAINTTILYLTAGLTATQMHLQGPIEPVPAVVLFITWITWSILPVLEVDEYDAVLNHGHKTIGLRGPAQNSLVTRVKIKLQSKRPGRLSNYWNSFHTHFFLSTISVVVSAFVFPRAIVGDSPNKQLYIVIFIIVIYITFSAPLVQLTDELQNFRERGGIKYIH